MTNITQIEWMIYPKEQRARIAAAWLADKHSDLIRYVIKGVGFVTLNNFIDIVRRLIDGETIPDWSSTKCSLALRRNWRDLAMPFAHSYLATSGERKQLLETMAREFLAREFPGKTIVQLLMGE